MYCKRQIEDDVSRFLCGPCFFFKDQNNGELFLLFAQRLANAYAAAAQGSGINNEYMRVYFFQPRNGILAALGYEYIESLLLQICSKGGDF